MTIDAELHVKRYFFRNQILRRHLAVTGIASHGSLHVAGMAEHDKIGHTVDAGGRDNLLILRQRRHFFHVPAVLQDSAVADHALARRRESRALGGLYRGVANAAIEFERRVAFVAEGRPFKGRARNGQGNE
jgi:hypothetical protein